MRVPYFSLEYVYTDWDRNFMIKVNERNVVKNTMISMLFFFYCDISTATAVMLTLEQNEGTFLQFYNDIYKKTLQRRKLHCI